MRVHRHRGARPAPNAVRRAARTPSWYRALALLTLAGCASSWSVGGGPVVDTVGRVGIMAVVGASSGLGGVNEAWPWRFELDSGPRLDRARGELHFQTGPEFVAIDDELTWRVGLRGGIHSQLGGHSPETTGSVGAAAALLFRVDEHPDGEPGSVEAKTRVFDDLGVELQAHALLPLPDREAAYGHFGLFVVYEQSKRVPLF